jgi:hypothetical protein
MAFLSGIFAKLFSWIGPLLVDRLISAVKSYLDKKRIEKEQAEKFAEEKKKSVEKIKEVLKEGTEDEQKKAFDDLFDKWK